MDKIKQLRENRQAAIDEAKAVVTKAKDEGRDLEPDELAKVEELTAKAAELRDQIDQAVKDEQKRQATLAALDAEEAEDKATQPALVRPDPNAGNGQTRNGRTRVSVTGGEAASQWAHFGEFLFAVRHAALTPFADRRLEPVPTTPQAAAPGMRSDVDSEGGFLIPDQFRNQLLERVYAQGELLSRVKASGMYMSLSGNTLKIPRVAESSRADGSRWGGVRGYWTAETDSITDSKPKFGQMTLSLHKAGVVGYITDEMLDDSPAAGQFLERAMTKELIFTVENALVNGNGSNKPLGLIAANCAVQVTKETNQTAATIWGPNIVKMWARLWASSRPTSIWLINQSCETYLWDLALEGRYGSASTSAAGVPLYHPANTVLNQGQYNILMGRPVIPVEYCQALGTAGDIILWDPSQYVIVDKAGGPQMASSIHVRFLTDEATFRVTYRIDGQPSWDSALTPYAGDTLSPIVLLGARS